LFLGGQYTPFLGGQHAPFSGGHFNPFLGGQHERFFQFTTTYDLVAADIIAHQMLKKYYFPDKEECKTRMPVIPKRKWTASKSDFIELVYGLQASKAVNYGDVEIIELCQALQSIFRIQIDDPYRIFTDLANRKTAQVKFIPKMEEGFLSKVDEMNTKK
jgi:hypothetical protein